MPTIHIPGPGAAMALAAAVSIYSTAKIAELKDYKLTGAFLIMTGIFISAVIVIEYMHIIKDKMNAKWTEGILVVLLIIIMSIGLIHFIVYLLY